MPSRYEEANRLFEPERLIRLKFMLFYLTYAAIVYGQSAQPLAASKISQLLPGQSVERELEAGHRHSYQVTLEQGQCFKAVVTHYGHDVIVNLYDPTNKTLALFDLNWRKNGQEIVTGVAATSGAYRLEVAPKLKNAQSGRYTITLSEVREANDNDRTLQEARTHEHLALQAFNQGMFKDAVPPQESAVKLFESVLGENHLETARALNQLGDLYRRAGLGWDKAEATFQRAYQLREKLVGPEQPETADSLTYLGILQWEKGRYDQAERLLQQSLKIKEAALGTEHPEFAFSLFFLGRNHSSKGAHALGETIFQRVLTLRQSALGHDHPDVGITYNMLGISWLDLGNYEKAEYYYQQSIATFSQTPGTENGQIGAPLNNLCNLYRNQGAIEKAREKCERSAYFFEKSVGTEHPNTAIVLSNLALLHSLSGEYAKANALFERVIAIREKTLGAEHRMVAEGFFHWGNVYLQEGTNDKAVSLYQRSIAIFEKALGPTHGDIARPLTGLGVVYREQGKFALAEALLRRALAIRENAFGLEHDEVAATLYELALLLERKGDFSLAELLLQRAQAIQEKAYGPQHYEVAKTLKGLATLYEAQGNASLAIAAQARANAISEHNLAINLVFGSERQKRGYLETFTNEVDRTVSLHLRSASSNNAARDAALTLILQRKGRLLETATDELALLRRNLTKQEQALLDRLQKHRAELARLVLNGAPADFAAYRTKVHEYEEQIESIEADISRRSAKYRAQNQSVTLAGVQAAIPAEAALVEFVIWRPFNQTKQISGEPRCAAYVLPHDGEAQFIDLGEVLPIEQAITAWRRSLRDARRTNVKALARNVDQKVMQPVRALVGNAKHLLIAPDGALNLIPFAALVDEQHRFLLEHYDISYLTSGRELLRLELPRESGNLPLIVANPDFGWDTTTTQDTRTGLGKGTQRSYFLPLTGTAREAKTLHSLMPEAIVLTGSQATETNLKQASGPRILHIATHGFFLTEQSDAPSEKEVRQKILLRSGIPAALNGKLENPLLRSGLGFAGANLGASGDDDGILTALEVLGLNLWGTKLAVLSACDTGIGEIKRGEGVYGLRRAFTQAGTETLMMSLWPVNDLVTRELMAAFYTRLQQGQGRGAALRQTQLEMLKQPKRRHPFYWAGFIQAGEWGTLAGQR